MHAREGNVRYAIAALEHDVAVQVGVDAAGARRCVFVPDERREGSGDVVTIRGGDGLAPRGPHDLHVQMLAYAWVRVAHEADIRLHRSEDALPLHDRLGRAYRLGDRMVIGGRVRVGHGRQHAEIVGMVGNHLEV